MREAGKGLCEDLVRNPQCAATVIKWGYLTCFSQACSATGSAVDQLFGGSLLPNWICSKEDTDAKDCGATRDGTILFVYPEAFREKARTLDDCNSLQSTVVHELSHFCNAHNNPVGEWCDSRLACASEVVNRVNMKTFELERDCGRRKVVPSM
jgi:hypothetical protein